MSNPLQLNGATDRNSPNTLFIKSLEGELIRDEIVSHFTAFGDVRICAFVEFTKAESVAKALETEIHAIAGRRVEVTIADDDRPHDEPTFLDLNDDCIHGILSTECLSALDWCSVAETSRRLKDITVRVFKRKHAKCDLSSLADREMKSAQRILRNFGAVISDLKIDGWHFKDNGTSVLDSAAKYCSNTLESLYLVNCVIPYNFTAKLKPLFNRLQKLKIGYCTFDRSNAELFADCGSLVELEIHGQYYSFIVENTFPKLRKFKCGYTTADEINLDSFILRHKNLTSIKICSYQEMSSLLPIIGDNCKQLEELEFLIREDKRYDISSLGHLRKLNIFCEHRDALKVVQGWNNLQFLEDLSLERASVASKFVETLSQLKRLQVLRLWQCDGLENLHRIGDLSQLTELVISARRSVDLDIVALIKRLSNLKVLNVKVCDFKMDLETYLRIVDGVRARRDKSKLTFKMKIHERNQYDAGMLQTFSLNAHIVEMITKN